MKPTLQEILLGSDTAAILAVFRFNKTNSDEEVLLKYSLWCRYFFPKYFTHSDAPFHRAMDMGNLKVYRGRLKSFVNIAFRGSAKTSRTKLFIAFCVANDEDNSRRYFKVLTKDFGNAKQYVTDIYNMFIETNVHNFYPHLFAKTLIKREETMASFTTSTGIKVIADTVGTDQRGQLQEASRPDFIVMDDFETRKTLRSAVETQAIFDNMEEARTGLSQDGGVVYTGNYLSERGNVHRLIQPIEGKEVLITPILKDGVPSWPAYTLTEIQTIKANADDFAGEYMCEPSAGADVFFDRSSIDHQKSILPIREVAGFKMFYKYDASHRYGGGMDVAGGVGLDSSASVWMDFTTMPNKVVATFKSNSIAPDIFGYEIIHQASLYGNPIVAIENNKFDMCIGVLKAQDYERIYFTEQSEKRVALPKTMRTYGWNTNSMTKPKMLNELKRAVEDGHLDLTDADIISELRSYSRDDLMDRDIDARLTTRHFDLLIACAIAYQLRSVAEQNEDTQQRARQYFESQRNLSANAR
jgi:hypothetical protein